MKKKIFLITCALFAATILYSQEICDNGIDDDGDGLIDLNDSLDCVCNGSSSSTVPSLIPNPSFEDYSCCPSSWSQLNCADTWVQASGATSDYLNTCNYTGNAPLPFPDGNAAAAMIFEDSWTEYIGACLLQPMLAGDDYQISFYLGFKYLTGSVLNCTSTTILPPIEFTIFGTTSCTHLPFTGSSNCPVGQGSWVALGSVLVDPMAIQGTWGTFTINFTPTFDVNAIVMGAPCTFPPGGLYDNTGCVPFFFIDGLTLNATTLFGLTLTESGHYCTNDWLLTVVPDTVGTIQWYYDGIALPGETNTTLDISGNGYPNGDYQAVFTYGTECVVGEISIAYTPPTASASNDTTLCDGGTATIFASGGATYNWDNGLGAGASHSVSPAVTTTYNVTVYDANGCTDTESVTVSVDPSPIANAGSGGTFCSDNYTFTAVASVGTGTWTYTGPLGGNATFSPDINTANATVTVDTWGTYTFTWTEDNNGCIDSDDVTVTFNYTPTSDFTAVPNSVCIGEDVIVTYTGTASPTANYIWDFDGGNATPGIGQGPHTVNWPTITNANIKLQVEENGCYSLITGVPVTVFSPHTSNFSITQPLCFGDNAILTYTGDAPATATFNWSFGVGTATPGGTVIGPQYVSYPSANTYTVSLEVTENNCVSPITTHQVIVQTELIAGITGTNLSCYGMADGATDLTSSGGVLPYTYYWSNGQTSEDLINIAADFYSVTVTDANLCTTTALVEIIEPAEIVITQPLNDNICNGQTVLLSTVATGGSGTYFYVWNGDITTTSTIAASPTVTTTYTVSVYDDNGCTSNTVSATIYVAPDVTLELFTNHDTICPGDPVYIHANYLSGVPPYYLTLDDGSVISTPFIVNPTEETEYIVYVTDQCGTVAVDSVTIYIYPVTIPQFQADPSSGCTPLTVNFHENNPNLYEYYLWNFGDNDFDNLSFDDDPVHIYDDPGTYNVTLTVTSYNGCESKLTIPNMITVYPTPHAQFIAEPEVVSIIKPYIYFENFSSLADQYLWVFGDGDSSSIINPIHIYPMYPTGTYNVTLIAYTLFGCTDTAYQEVIVQDEYTFYAPTAFSPDFDGINDYFIIKGNGIDKRNFNMIIYDRWGEEIFETDDLYMGWDGRVKGGDIAKNGVYTWLVKYKDLKDIEHEEAGAVTVIR